LLISIIPFRKSFSILVSSLLGLLLLVLFPFCPSPLLGLMVPLPDNVAKALGSGQVGQGTVFKVPALLPDRPLPRTDFVSRSCFYVFFSLDVFNGHANKQQMKSQGFLPDGLFARFLGTDSGCFVAAALPALPALAACLVCLCCTCALPVLYLCFACALPVLCFACGCVVGLVIGLVIGFVVWREGLFRGCLLWNPTNRMKCE